MPQNIMLLFLLSSSRNLDFSTILPNGDCQMKVIQTTVKLLIKWLLNRRGQQKKYYFKISQNIYL